MIPSESERGRSDSEARTETCDAVSDLLPTPALPVAPTPPRNPCRSPLFSSVLFSAGPTRRWQARTKYLLPTAYRSTCFLGNGLFSPFLSPPPLDWPTPPNPTGTKGGRRKGPRLSQIGWKCSCSLDLYKSITTEQILWNALINGCHWTMPSSSPADKA